MLNCFQKTFRYLAYANTVQTFFTGDPEVIRSLMDDGEDPLTAGVGMDKPIEDIDGNKIQIPSRQEMESMVEAKKQAESMFKESRN